MALDIESKQTIDDAISNLKETGLDLIAAGKQAAIEAGKAIIDNTFAQASNLAQSFANAAGSLEHHTAANIIEVIDHAAEAMKSLELQILTTVTIVKVNPEDK